MLNIALFWVLLILAYKKTNRPRVSDSNSPEHTWDLFRRSLCLCSPRMTTAFGVTALPAFDIFRFP